MTQIIIIRVIINNNYSSFESLLNFSGGIGESNNHAILTAFSFGKRVPFQQLDITMAHELGHLFGSTHDPKVDGNMLRHVLYSLVCYIV